MDAQKLLWHSLVLSFGEANLGCNDAKVCSMRPLTSPAHSVVQVLQRLSGPAVQQATDMTHILRLLSSSHLLQHRRSCLQVKASTLLQEAQQQVAGDRQHISDGEADEGLQGELPGQAGCVPILGL